MLLKTIFNSYCILFAGAFIFAQKPVVQFDSAGFPDQFYAELKKNHGKNKTYPPEFENQILIALSYYPELKSTAIKFRKKIRHGSMTARATWAGIFQRRSRRHYVVTISDHTEPILTPLLVKNLSFNAQVGVLGHELAHITDFSSMTTFQILGHGISSVNQKYVDRFEYRTDSICIAHGLGYQLLEWSQFVRSIMKTEFWRGPDHVHKVAAVERYMNPLTIKRLMEGMEVYK